MVPFFSPYDVLCAGRWRAALLTTFSLSLSFFEAVPLHALRKGGAQDVGILADVAGYRASLAEAGVSDVGRTYDLVPLRVAGGCFHPKVIVVDGPDGLRAAVGSGNLTFGGWGHNIETLDLLVPALDPEAYNDLADFLGYLALFIDEGAGAARPSVLDAMAGACRKAGRGGGGRTRLLHTFDGPIAAQLASHAAELGGAEDVTVVSPFFGGPEAVLALAAALGTDRVRVAVAGRAPEFFDFAAAQALGTRVEPVRSDAFSSTASLHAKVLEVTCRRGRLVLSGSANATRPALLTAANVEASVLRTVDDRLTFGWCAADPRDVSDGDGGDPDPDCGPCLSSRFDGRAVRGRLIGQDAPAGSWSARIVSGTVHASLDPVAVASDGAFEIGPGSTWPVRNLVHSTQLILARAADEVRGWIVFDYVLGAVRERGPVAEAMLRTLAGSEEPDDVAVILSFFVANPGAFFEEDGAAPGAGPTSRHFSSVAGGSVDLAGLEPTVAFAEVATADPAGGATAFERLLAAVRRHMREAPRPVRALADAGDVGDALSGAAGEAGALPRWRVGQIVEALAGLVEALPRDAGGFRRHAVSLLDFVLFAADRSEEPEEVKAEHLRKWLGVVRSAGAARGGPDVLDRAFAAVLASRVVSDPARARGVHASLQGWCRGLLDPAWVEAVTPSSAGVRERRLQEGAGDDAWVDAMRRTVSTRTAWMDVVEVQRAVAGSGPMPRLPVALAPEAAILGRVAAGKARPQRVVALAHRSARPACPRCYLDLPLFARERLREHRLVLTHCCDRVLLDPLLE